MEMSEESPEGGPSDGFFFPSTCMWQGSFRERSPAWLPGSSSAFVSVLPGLVSKCADGSVYVVSGLAICSFQYQRIDCLSLYRCVSSCPCSLDSCARARGLFLKQCMGGVGAWMELGIGRSVCLPMRSFYCFETQVAPTSAA